MTDSKDMLKVIIDALQDKKAEDIRVIGYYFIWNQYRREGQLIWKK